MKPLVHSPTPITDELIEKMSHLLIDSFILWYRSLAFYPFVDDTLNELIRSQRWSKCFFLVICYFVTSNITYKHFVSYDQSFQRLTEHQGNNLVTVRTNEIFEELRGFLIQLNNLHLTAVEFSLLSILLVIQYGKEREEGENNFIESFLFHF